MQMNKDQINASLEQYCRFLAYVRVNALLHDCDKSFAQFLLWSLVEKLPKEIKADRPSPCNYDGHNLPGPTSSTLRNQYVKQWQEDVVKTTADLESGTDVRFPVASCYLSYRTEDGEPYDIRQDKIVLCRSLYDFSVFHHDRTDYIKKDAPTSLLLFTSGSGGIDGRDTGYEIEMKKHHQDQFRRRQENKETFNYHGHHSPDTTNKNIVLISTPFGFEQPVALQCAEKTCHFSQEIKEIVFALRDDKQPMSVAAQLEEKIE